jgi:hypothetical protein
MDHKFLLFEQLTIIKLTMKQSTLVIIYDYQLYKSKFNNFTKMMKIVMFLFMVTRKTIPPHIVLNPHLQSSYFIFRYTTIFYIFTSNKEWLVAGLWIVVMNQLSGLLTTRTARTEKGLELGKRMSKSDPC